MKMDILVSVSEMIYIHIKVVKMKILLSGIILLFVLFFSSCQGNLDSWIGDYYKAHISSGRNEAEMRNDKILSSGDMPEKDSRTCIVDLKNITPFKWDTVYIVDGYVFRPEIREFINYKRHNRFPHSFCRKTLFSKGNRIVYMYFQEEYLSDPIISSPQMLEMWGRRKFANDNACFLVTIKNHEYHLEHILSKE